MIVIDSALLEQLGPGEQRVVLAHEVGHILSDHMLYMTALNILLARRPLSMPFFLGLPVRAPSAPCCSSGIARPSSAATAPPRSPSATRRSSAGR